MESPANGHLLHRRGFTLVEIAIATMILVTTGLLVLMMLPGALRSQQMSRYQMLAAAHAQSSIAAFTQHELDLREVQAGFAFGKDGVPEPDQGRLRQELVQRRMMSSMGHYDLERVVTNRMHGNYPVPLDIARRLDSPGDEIRKVLDGGGYIYYSDPLAAGRTDDKQRRISADLNERADASRMVWAVVGSAQQNLLPLNPWAEPHSELYPFPPISRPRGVDRYYKGQIAYALEKDGPERLIPKGATYQGAIVEKPFTAQEWRLVRSGDTFYVRDAHVGRKAAPNDTYLYGKEQESFYQSNNWEWLAEQEPGSPWATGLEEYRRLANLHWLRILDQIASIEVELIEPEWRGGGGGGGGGGQKKIKKEKRTYYVKRKHYKMVMDSDGIPVRNALGQPTWEEVETEEEITEEVVVEEPGKGEGEGGGGGGKPEASGLQNIAELPDGYYTTWRGFPAPAKGMPTSTLRGSDILEEDAAACSEDLPGQIRIGLPSLERRAAYRAAALALWAKVAYGKDIVDPRDPNKVFVEQVFGEQQTPEGGAGGRVTGGKSYLAVSENPLTRHFRMPSPLHPAQVLALSYVAHAAVMVTGYKPPFYHSHDTLTAHDDALLVSPTKHHLYEEEQEKLPYCAVEATWLVDDRGQDVTGEIELLKKDGSFVRVPLQSDGSISIGGLAGSLDDSLKAPTDDAAMKNSGRFVDRDGLPSDQPVVIAGYNWLWNPYHPDLVTNDRQTAEAKRKGDIPIPHAHRTDAILESADAKEFQLHASTGRPISQRRMIGGIINEFPPPYADRGGIDSEGRRRYAVRWQLAVEWLKGQIPAGDPSKPDAMVPGWIPEYRLLRKVHDYEGRVTADSILAKEAHEHALEAAMTYVSANPYDITVPKPLNRQTFVDRGIYQFDLFDGAGKAVRPQAIEGKNRRYNSTYPITFHGGGARGDRVAFGVQRATPEFIDSPVDYLGQMDPERPGRKTNRGHYVSQPLAPSDSGQPFTFGAVHDGLPGDRCKDPWEDTRNMARWIDLAHGHRDAVGDDRPARPDRATAIRRFEADERCRQLVYWLVDWQRYEDAESAPSAPVDYAYLRRQQRAPFVYGKIERFDGKETNGWMLKVKFDAEHYDIEPGEQVIIGHDAVGEVRAELVDFEDAKGRYWLFKEVEPTSLAVFQTLVGSNAYLNIQRGSLDSGSEERWLERFLGGNPELDFVWVDPERTSTPVVWDRARAKRYDYVQAHGVSTEQALAFFASGHKALPLTDLRVSVDRVQIKVRKDDDGNPIIVDGVPQTWEQVSVQTQTLITGDYRELNPFIALGSFGADRNGDGVFAPGEVSTTTRMQASEIARFTFYDPIAWISLGR